MLNKAAGVRLDAALLGAVGFSRTSLRP